MSQSFTLEQTAVCKAVLHACKYPHAPVNGLLLGSRPPSPDSPIVVRDAVPLFHTNLNLTPMLEAALLQVEGAYRRLQIVGYYHGNELLHSNQPEGVAAQIYSKIVDNCGRCLLAQIDNSKLGRDCRQLPLLFFASAPSSYSSSASSSSASTSSQLQRLEALTAKQVAVPDEADGLRKLAALLRRRAYRRVVDFDNYLDDIRLDWRNRFLPAELRQIDQCVDDDTDLA